MAITGAQQGEGADLLAQQNTSDFAQSFLELASKPIVAEWVGALLVSITLFLMVWANRAAVRAAEHAETALKLSNPPRFKITRPVVYRKGGPETKVSDLPGFEAGEQIAGWAFAVNYGRYAATIKDSDCMFYWAANGIIPMHLMYYRMKAKDKWLALNAGGVIPPGGAAEWRSIQSTVPNGFEKKHDGWSHTLYLIGFVRYIGAAGDHRGLYFCKRYIPEEQRFVDADGYENED
ncbi:hypothetical protein [Hoeflea sp.]|uniref:hypothetical protein n=1 Tax=Hoeflea sp. TaxID=1940281 RepID=UPI00198A7925|nr:hypothetical protein [Hoeflea sp.]MBC7280056.1 hypothetical protein [Hoeflea sp.]